MADTILRLPFEALQSIPGGVNEVRLYHDDLLNCERVGKRLDLTMVQATVLPEASTLKSISHPNIVEVVSAVKVDDPRYDPLMDVIEIITPFYPRGSITDALLQGETFSTRQSMLIMQAALRGLRELHVRHDILHRDVKSGNILLTEAPTYAVVADIGVAGSMAGSGAAPAVNNPTLYSPPELLETGVLTVSSDLYSMGLVMSELLGGPFDYGSYNREEVYKRLESGESPLTAQDFALPIWAPSTLHKIHMKATATQPSRRYQSAKQMDDAIGALKLANWTQEADLEWHAAGPGRTPIVVKVEAVPVAENLLLSIKKASGHNWRRQQNRPDVEVGNLHDLQARLVFDAANALAMG
jgi:serine/threonine protein kinase